MIYIGFSLIFGSVLALMYSVDEEQELPDMNPLISTAFFLGFCIAWFLSVIRFRTIPCCLTVVFVIGCVLVLIGNSN